MSLALCTAVPVYALSALHSSPAVRSWTTSEVAGVTGVATGVSVLSAKAPVDGS